MIKDLWLNLPVKDVVKSKAFFMEIGFKLNEQFSNDNAASFIIGEQRIVLMLFPEDTFKSFTLNPISETEKGTEVLFSFSAASQEEVDIMADKVWKAGGTIFSKPQEIHGWMYGFGFIDLDGHRWNMVYMDVKKMQ